MTVFIQMIELNLKWILFKLNDSTVTYTLVRIVYTLENGIQVYLSLGLSTDGN